ncbi:MAG: hypothetical protein HZA54_08630 [Planctomycetes bacterium]|nr:hypothetical protein [Planctomycetota bacterium]
MFRPLRRLLTCVLWSLAALSGFAADDTVVTVLDVGDLVGLPGECLSEGLAELAGEVPEARELRVQWLAGRGPDPGAGAGAGGGPVTVAELVGLLRLRAGGASGPALEPVRNGIGLCGSRGAERGAAATLDLLRRAALRFRRLRVAWLSVSAATLRRLEEGGAAVPGVSAGTAAAEADTAGVAGPPVGTAISAAAADALLEGAGAGAGGASGLVLGAWSLCGRIGQTLEVSREAEIAYVGDLAPARAAGQGQWLPRAARLRHGLTVELQALGSARGGAGGGAAEAWAITWDLRRLQRLEEMAAAGGRLELPVLARQRRRVVVGLPAGGALLVPLPYEPGSAVGPTAPAAGRDRGEPERRFVLLLMPLGRIEPAVAPTGPPEPAAEVGSPAAGAGAGAAPGPDSGAAAAESLELYEVADLLAQVADYGAAPMGVTGGSAAPGSASVAKAPPPAPASGPGPATVADLMAAFERLTRGLAGGAAGGGGPAGSLFGELAPQGTILMARGSARAHRRLQDFLTGVRRQQNLLVRIEVRVAQVEGAAAERVRQELAGAAGAGEVFADAATARALVAGDRPGVRLVCAPRLATFAGQRANLFVGEQTAYVAEYDTVAAGVAEIVDPRVGTTTTGVTLAVRAVPTPDRRQVVLEVEWRTARAGETRKHEFALAVGGGREERLTLDLPQSEHEGLVAGLVVPDGGAYVLRRERQSAPGQPAGLELVVVEARLSTLDAAEAPGPGGAPAAPAPEAQGKDGGASESPK